MKFLLALLFAASTFAATPTFNKDIAPIFQDKCAECHHAGTGAPMSLVTYSETRPWAKAIRERVAKRSMPPWAIDPTVGIQSFQNDRSLTPAQIATIVNWVDAGAPEGDPKDLAQAKQWPNGQDWQLAKQYGQPDLVVSSAPYTMPAHSQDQWWKPTTPVSVDEPRWVRAVEMRPGTNDGRKITHHALAQLVQTEPDGKPSPPGLLMEWAIGKSYDTYRDGSGKLLMPGAQISWDIHYHAVNEEITDHVELAIYLYPKGYVPEHRTRLMLFSAYPSNNSLDIQPNSIAETQTTHVLTQAARLENFQPHMHLRGKAMKMEAILPDGTVRVLSYVDRFSFNWMNNYIYSDAAAPILPKGTVLRITAWHDNTRANPNNPDPDEWVGYGDRTVDEMAHAWVNVTYLTEEEYEVSKQR